MKKEKLFRRDGFPVDGSDYRDVTVFTLLTLENAPKVAVIQNINNPEWGTMRFVFHDEPLGGGKFCSN